MCTSRDNCSDSSTHRSTCPRWNWKTGLLQANRRIYPWSQSYWGENSTSLWNKMWGAWSFPRQSCSCWLPSGHSWRDYHSLWAQTWNCRTWKRESCCIRQRSIKTCGKISKHAKTCCDQSARICAAWKGRWVPRQASWSLNPEGSADEALQGSPSRDD